MNNKNIFFLISLIFFSFSTPSDVKIEKKLLYTQYTLDDNYTSNRTKRMFQWGKISHKLDSIELFITNNSVFAILCNYKNIHGIAPLVTEYSTDEYGVIQDKYNTPRNQSIPLYEPNTTNAMRYGRDGSLVALIGSSNGYYTIEHPFIGGTWNVPKKYVTILDETAFKKTIFIDKKNQNIATLEKIDSVWYVRSMNPATTGLHKPPYQRRTPSGIFVMQSKLPKMVYYVDGTREIGGFSPYASRFCCGGYIHGIPVNLPAKEIIEYSATLGTTPRSHMCVRNASSHAKFVYDWGEINKTLIFVIE